MEDDFKHADEYEEEIRNLIDETVGGDLMRAMTAQNICPKCMALTMLEFAAYAATSAGATAGEILATLGSIWRQPEAAVFRFSP